MRVLTLALPHRFGRVGHLTSRRGCGSFRNILVGVGRPARRDDLSFGIEACGLARLSSGSLLGGGCTRLGLVLSCALRCVRPFNQLVVADLAALRIDTDLHVRLQTRLGLLFLGLGHRLTRRFVRSVLLLRVELVFRVLFHRGGFEPMRA